VIAFLAVEGRHVREIKVNKVDLIDVDQFTPRTYAQGTTWFTLYSPEVGSYTLGLEPAAPVWSRSGDRGRQPVVLSWMGRPETGGLNSTGRGSVQTIYRGKYDYAPDAAGVRAVPLPYGSTKSFVASWAAPIPPPLKADLVYAQKSGEGLSGIVINRLPVELQDPALFYGGKWYPLPGPLSPGQKIKVTGQEGREFGDWHNVRLNRERPADGFFDATGLIKTALFAGHLTQGEIRRNNLLRSLDQSWRVRGLDPQDLAPQEAVFFARLPRAQGPAEEIIRGAAAPTRLWLGALPGTGQERRPLPGTLIQDTYLRVYLTVRASPDLRAGE
jgi:hypothetical protein